MPDAKLPVIQQLIAAVRRDQDARNDRAILIPEQDTEWPDGYDFSELEKADDECEAAQDTLEQLLKLAENIPEPVRCKDCRHFDNTNAFLYYGEPADIAHCTRQYPKIPFQFCEVPFDGSHFCGFAEPKTGGAR